MGAAPPTTEPGVGQTNISFTPFFVMHLFQFDIKSINIRIAGGYVEYAARCYAKLREPRGHVPRPVPVNCHGAWVPGYLSLPGCLSLRGCRSIPGYLSQLGKPVPDPAPVNLCQKDYPALIETIVLLKQCSSEVQTEEQELRQC